MRFLPLLLTCLLCAGPARPDCAEEVDALFDGPLDSAARPPHHQVMAIYDSAGNLEMAIDQWVENPLVHVSHIRGQPYFTIVRDRKMWQGPGFDGPWTYLGETLPEGRDAIQRQADADYRANVSDPVCPPDTEIGGRPTKKYEFRTRTNPAQGGIWFGALMTVYVDVESGHVVRQEQRENVAHYQPQPDDKVNVTGFDYDAEFNIPAPPG